jgi:glucose/arabinose dehydrogenase
MPANTAYRNNRLLLICALFGSGLVLTACGESAKIPESETVGANPTLPPPNKTLIPTVNVATAKGWSGNETPKPAGGLRVTALARNLDHPRWIHVLPNGDILIAETNAPERPERSGVKSMAMGYFMKKAGAGVPSANRITLLRDANGDGTAEIRTTFLKDLNSPFGMALIGDSLYVANTDAIVRFPYKEGQTEIREAGTRLADLPAGSINHHWTKGLVASRDGKFLYASVGSNSNVAENGIEEETNRAAILEVAVDDGKTRLFASGLRNPVGMSINPDTGELWAVINERDEIGSDLVPDYLTSVKDGGFYGWPWSYFGKHVDDRVKPPRPDLVAKAIVPDYALGNHVAPLGMTFAANQDWPVQFRQGAIVGLHGSWNRKPHSGYKVVFVPFKDGRPIDKPIDLLTGFLSAEGEALGRPVGVEFDRRGGLLVADDVGNVIWRVSPQD